MKNKTLFKQALDHAADLILLGWTKELLAGDADGNEVPENSEEAVSFCLIGAYSRAAHDLGIGDEDYKLHRPVRQALHDRGYRGMISDWNNRVAKSAEEVAAVLREAKKYV